MEIITEDKVTLKVGERAYNYYDRKSGIIGEMSAFDGWFDFAHDDGTFAYLNGSRICSVNFARTHGWM